MFNVAIIGKNSYIGSHIACVLKEKGMSVVEVDALENKWTEFNFSSVDTVIHVAAIVHRKDILDSRIYNEVNVKFPVAVAKLAKSAGVKQFIYMSSMAVYGKGHVLKDCCVYPSSTLNPTTEYAKSKLQAEKELRQMIDGDMILSIVRPPSVYGSGCKGNLFDIYGKIAANLWLIPECEPNCLQGLLYIDNLCSVAYEIIKNRKAGYYHPQDSELLSTAELLNEIRKYQGKKSSISRALGKVTSIFSFMSIYKKLFGAVYYSADFKEHEGISSTMLTTREGLWRMYHEES